jgi:hypothetical protein
MVSHRIGPFIQSGSAGLCTFVISASSEATQVGQGAFGVVYARPPGLARRAGDVMARAARSIS